MNTRAQKRVIFVNKYDILRETLSLFRAITIEIFESETLKKRAHTLCHKLMVNITMLTITISKEICAKLSLKEKLIFVNLS
jgi:hypothetical protein